MDRYTFHELRLLPRKIASSAISVYQATLSPDHGPLRYVHPFGFCRHEPTCSEYGRRVILERGILLGTPLLLRRLLSCHPWKKTGEEKLRKILGV